MSAYRTYRRRWGVLATVMITNFTCFTSSSCYFPVVAKTAEYFNVDHVQIDYFSLLTLSITAPGMLVAVFIAKRFGLRWCFASGCTLVFIGSLTRILASFPFYDFGIPPEQEFVIAVVGQVVVAAGHPFILIISTQVSQTWFSKSERMLSTSLLAMVPNVAVVVTSLLSPAIVNEEESNVAYINLLYGAPSVIGFMCAVIFCRTSQPPTPPSKSAEEISKPQTFSLRQYAFQMKSILCNKTMVGFIFFTGALLSKFNATNSQMSQMMCSVGYTATQAGHASALLMISGTTGGIVVGTLARRLKKQLDFFKISYCISSLAFITLMLLLREPEVFPAIMCALSVVGFFGIGCFPLSLELSVEETFPLDPVYSETAIHFPAMTYAFVLINICNNLNWEQSQTVSDTCGDAIQPLDYTPYFYYLMAEITVSSCLMLFVINPQLKRYDFDKNEEE